MHIYKHVMPTMPRFTSKCFLLHLPQNGMPSGSHWPLSHVRREGPSNSKPLSQVYVATVPGPNVSSENTTLECAGAPGNRQLFVSPVKRKKEENIKLGLVYVHTAYFRCKNHEI